MTPHALPPAAGRNPDGLVVIPVGSTRRESIVQPKSILGRDGVRDVRERCGALIRSHDQIWIRRVEREHVLRRNRGPVDQVVRQIEQPAHQRLILTLSLLVSLFGVGRSHPGDKTTLRSARNDDGILDHLRVYEPQHLGAEIIRTIAPANATTRHRRPTEVHSLHSSRMDPHLEQELGRSRVFQVANQELKRDVGDATRTARRDPAAPAVVVRPNHR